MTFETDGGYVYEKGGERVGRLLVVPLARFIGSRWCVVTISLGLYKGRQKGIPLLGGEGFVEGMQVHNALEKKVRRQGGVEKMKGLKKENV